MASDINTMAALISSKQALIALAALVSMCAPAWPSGAVPIPPITNLLRDQYGSVEGLPQNSVHSCARTTDGYLWIATQGGLARFDGIRFQNFQMQNTPGLPQDNIHFLAAARDGSLWVGTYSRGVGHLLEGKFVPLAGLLSPVIRSIVEDHEGVIWIGTAAGLNRWKDGHLLAHTTKDGLASNDVQALLEDGRGRLWIGTGGGLSLLDHGRFVTFAAQDRLAGTEARSLAMARDGSVWVASPQIVARLRDGLVAEWYGKDRLPVRESIQRVAVAADQSLWIGTFGSGLLRLRDGRFELYGPSQGLTSGAVLSLLAEADGTLWVGTAEGGLNRLQPRRLRMIGAPEGLSDTAADAVLEAPDGSLWIATVGHGLNRYQNGRVRVYTTRDGLSSDTVLSLFWSARTGKLWVGTEDGALNWLGGGRFHRLSLRPGNRPARIFEQPDGVMWVCTTKGLFRIENGAITRIYTTAEGLPSNVVLAAIESRDGSLWLGTGNGLSRYRNGQFTNYAAAQRPGAYGPRVDWVYEDTQGVLWLGSAGNGLGRFHDGRLSWVGTLEGLNDNVVYSVLEDDRGDLWLSTNRGICRVAKRQLSDLAAGRVRRVTARVYGVSDGMRSAECNGDTQPAGWKTHAGELLFACIGGVVGLDPAKLPRATQPPAVLIEQAELNGKALSPRFSEAHIPPGDGNLEFTYTGIDFAAPGQVRFRYRLENVDRDWVEAGTRRAAYYTNIPPGGYRFRVTAENADGLSGETDMAFVLEPRFRQTVTFQVICVALLLALAAGLYHWRTRRIQARQRELERLVQQRTAELEESHRKLQVAATHDGLTQLWNRHTVMEILSGELARCQREHTTLAVVLVDLDHFKRINDTYGHPAGDAVLQEISRRFQSVIRPYDSAGRYGGEEFLLILPGVPPSEVEGRLHQMHQSVCAAPFPTLDHASIRATCSFGVVCIAEEAPLLEQVNSNADAALYRAKALGRNRIEYSEPWPPVPVAVH